MPTGVLKQADLIAIRDLPGLLPGRPSLPTIYRWISRGIDGIRLASVRVGGRRFVNKAALVAFVEALSADPPGKRIEPAGAARRRTARQAESVKEYLDSEGL